MLTRHIALVTETEKVHSKELTHVAAALEKQVTHDFEPMWGVAAKVSAYADSNQVPLDCWRITVKDHLSRPDAAGYHEDKLGQPYAVILPEDHWSVSASHEMLEMLADPWGRHLFAGPSPKCSGRKVMFLVEVCDPCSDARYSYEVDGIRVSDFYTPHFFDLERSNVPYSRTRAIEEPRQVLRGGYLTWYDPETRKWWHRAWFNGSEPKDEKIRIPAIMKGNIGNIRARIDRHIRRKRSGAST
jgi:hypothetical protein